MYEPKEKEDWINTFLEKHIGKLFILAIVIIFGSYLFYSWFNPEPYRHHREPYDNRWGQ